MSSIREKETRMRKPYGEYAEGYGKVDEKYRAVYNDNHQNKPACNCKSWKGGECRHRNGHKGNNGNQNINDGGTKNRDDSWG